MSTVFLLLALAAAAGLLWRKLDAGQQATAQAISALHLAVTAGQQAVVNQVHALEQQQDSLTTAIRDAGQRITNFSFPPLPEPQVVTITKEVPVVGKHGAPNLKAPQPKQVCLVLMDEDERAVRDAVWINPRHRSQTIRVGSAAYSCVSGSEREGHFVYRAEAK